MQERKQRHPGLALVALALGAVFTWGGLRDTIAYWGTDLLNTAVAGPATLLGVALVFAAVGLFNGRPTAFAVTVAASGGAIIVHTAGVLAGYIGPVPGLVLGILAPAGLLLATWRRPPSTASGALRRSDDPTKPADNRRDDGLHRAQTAPA
jgi:hypothetical protein